jgi:hypothetical protein
MRRPALTLSLLLACTANAPATPTPTVVVVEPAADAKAPAIPPPSTTPTPADPPVVADPTPPTDAPPQPPAAPADSTFQLAAHRDGDLELHRLGDEMFVVGGGGLAHADARGRLVAVEYGFTGMTAAEDWGTWNPLAFGGVWPHNAWLATQFEFSRGTSRPQLQRRDGAAWKPVANKDGVLFWYHDPMIAWREGQVLGVRRYIVDPNLSTEDAGEPTPPRIRKKIDAQLAAARHGIDVLGPTPTPATMVLDRGLDVLRLAAAPTGEVFALGSGTGEQLGEGFRVQRWGLAGDAAVAGAVHKIDKGIACAQIAVRSADEAYVGCTRGSKERAHILRFDGAAWTEEPAPAAPGILDLAVAPEGELWAVVGSEDTGADFVYGQVWRRTARGAAWQRVALPELRFADRGHDDIVFTPTSRYSRLPAEPEAAAKTWPVHPQQVLAGADGEVWIRGETYLERGEVSEFRGAGPRPRRAAAEDRGHLRVLAPRSPDDRPAGPPRDPGRRGRAARRRRAGRPRRAAHARVPLAPRPPRVRHEDRQADRRPADLITASAAAVRRPPSAVASVLWPGNTESPTSHRFGASGRGHAPA